MGPITRIERERWLTRHEYVNVDAIVGAAEKEGVLVVRAVAIVINETGNGKNVYSESEGPEELRNQHVTAENYHAIYEPWHAQTGGLTGIGTWQLTSFGYVEEANALGGVWNAYCAGRVALKLYHELSERGGPHWAAAAYNGGSGWEDSPGRAAAEKYADDFTANERRLVAEGLG